MYRKYIFYIAIFSLSIFSCTKLEEEFEGNLTADQVGGGGGSANTTALLKGVYDAIRLPFQNHENIYALWETTTDELLVPTRGPDWDDNGIWRVIFPSTLRGGRSVKACRSVWVQKH